MSRAGPAPRPAGERCPAEPKGEPGPGGRRCPGGAESPGRLARKCTASPARLFPAALRGCGPPRWPLGERRLELGLRPHPPGCWSTGVGEKAGFHLAKNTQAARFPSLPTSQADSSPPSPRDFSRSCPKGGLFSPEAAPSHPVALPRQQHCCAARLCRAQPGCVEPQPDFAEPNPALRSRAQLCRAPARLLLWPRSPGAGAGHRDLVRRPCPAHSGGAKPRGCCPLAARKLAPRPGGPQPTLGTSVFPLLPSRKPSNANANSAEQMTAGGQTILASQGIRKLKTFKNVFHLWLHWLLAFGSYRAKPQQCQPRSAVRAEIFGQQRDVFALKLQVFFIHCGSK